MYDYLPPMYLEMEEEAPSDAIAAEEGEAEAQVSCYRAAPDPETAE